MIDHGLSIRDGKVYLTISGPEDKIKEVAVNTKRFFPAVQQKGMILPDILSVHAQNIMDVYGLPKQLNQLMEECGELIAAANRYLRESDRWSTQELLEGAVDVIVMLDQILARMGVTEPELVFEEELKINRQLERIHQK